MSIRTSSNKTKEDEEEYRMTVVRTVMLKPRPGKTFEVLEWLPKFTPVFDELDLVGHAFWQAITGQNYGNIMVTYVAEDIEKLGAAQDTATANPVFKELLTDVPVDVTGSIISQTVSQSGSLDIDSVKLRASVLMSPNPGRGDDVLRRANRLSETLVECGAQASHVRSSMAGPAGPGVGVHTFYESWANWGEVREGLSNSQFWNVINKSQDDITSSGPTVQLYKKIAI